ncbi:MAG: hypothetical protein KC635_03020 [Myxococcales bacterium]|nr:hypothetical protein [Myxococcales bacterium]MCB9736192.1 hypothetical protein [Deltaproteobacteria bacterium]
MRWILALLVATTSLTTAACATSGSNSPACQRASSVEQARHPIVIFTNDQKAGEAFLEELRAAGYTHPASRIADDPNEHFNVKWGAASLSVVEDLAAHVRKRFGVEPRRLQVFEPDDLEIFLNLPLPSSGEYSGGPVGTGRGAFPVTVFTDDQARGAAFFGEVQGRGYTNDDGEVLPDPNDNFNIKWGAAPEEYVEELAAMVRERFGQDPKRLHIFDAEDPQIFINLPLGPGAARPAGPLRKADLHIVVFAPPEHAEVARGVLEQLGKLGYTNPQNEVSVAPNPEYNLKWGGAPQEAIDELLRVLQERFDQPFTPRHEFDPTDPDVFINLPLSGAHGVF